MSECKPQDKINCDGCEIYCPKEITQLQEDKKKLIEALEFYGDESNNEEMISPETTFEPHENYWIMEAYTWSEPVHRFIMDGGDRARKVLKEIKE